MKDDLTQLLAAIRQAELPFYPVILVFATGQVSEEECVPMPRVPMPTLGAPLNKKVALVIKDAFAINPSIHDGAIVFARSAADEQYFLSAWSMRIVSKKVSLNAEPNLGSAYNSALSLSMCENIDVCCIIGPKRTILFQDGVSYYVEC